MAWQMVSLDPQVGHDRGLLVHWTVVEEAVAYQGDGQGSWYLGHFKDHQEVSNIIKKPSLIIFFPGA